MAKHKYHHRMNSGKKALAYGRAEGFGPMLNVRHPRKVKPVLLDEKAPAGSADTDEGREKQDSEHEKEAHNEVL